MCTFRIKNDEEFRLLRDHNIEIELLWKDTKCIGDIGVVEMVNMWEIDGPVDVFIGTQAGQEGGQIKKKLEIQQIK